MPGLGGAGLGSAFPGGALGGLGAANPADVESMMNIIEDERLRGMQELEEHWNRLAKEKDEFQRRIQLGESRKRQENIVQSRGAPGGEGAGPRTALGPRTIVQQNTNMVGKV